MITVNGHKITPTIFPDKTSQVWKLPDLPSKCTILWEFEEEREIIDFLSVYKLLENLDKIINIEIPYLPYARQDKKISNETTFNLSVFEDILGLINCPISTIDCHGRSPGNVMSFFPIKEIQDAIFESQADILIYPDEGATVRYRQGLPNYPYVLCEKTRDHLTGDINGVIVRKSALTGYHRPLIVDDICDGGRTFIEVAKQVAPICPELSLYVTHGIFSKGLAPLREAGIKRIFTRKGEEI
jgi:ribose-phosphate pyrophosphokinase